jgi:hypothetical protein
MIYLDSSAMVKRYVIGEGAEKVQELKTIPVRTKLLIDSWTLVEKHHIYQADALQIVSAKHINANQLVTGDRKLAEIAKMEGSPQTMWGKVMRQVQVFPYETLIRLHPRHDIN